MPAPEGSRRRRRLLAALGSGVLLAAALAALSVLPYPLFPHHSRFGLIDLRSDLPADAEILEALRAADRRILAMPLHDPHERHELFLAQRESRYRLFAFLTRKPPTTQGLIVSSATGTVVLSLPGIRQVRERSGGQPAHSRLAGTLDAAIAHEVAHLTVRRRLGFLRNARLPAWKSEGWADYAAHRGQPPSHPREQVAARTALLLDSARWKAPLSAVDRRHYGWQILVEYLVEIEGLSFDALMDDAVAEGPSRARLLAWFATSAPVARP